MGLFDIDGSQKLTPFGFKPTRERANPQAILAELDRVGTSLSFSEIEKIGGATGSYMSAVLGNLTATRQIEIDGDASEERYRITGFGRAVQRGDEKALELLRWGPMRV